MPLHFTIQQITFKIDNGVIKGIIWQYNGPRGTHTNCAFSFHKKHNYNKKTARLLVAYRVHLGRSSRSNRANLDTFRNLLEVNPRSPQGQMKVNSRSTLVGLKVRFS